MSRAASLLKLAQIIEDLGWASIAMATDSGYIRGIIVGEEEFLKELSQVLTLFDGIDEADENFVGLNYFEDENKEVPKSRLVPKKGDDDDPTFH